MISRQLPRIKTKSFKSRKKSLLKKQISDFKKKSNIELPVVKEKKENLSVARLSQYDENERRMSLEKASEVQDEVQQQNGEVVRLGNVSELRLSLVNVSELKTHFLPDGLVNVLPHELVNFLPDELVNFYEQEDGLLKHVQ